MGLSQQAPGIEWEKSFGGGSNDFAYSVKATSDGGYIVAGTSYSQNGQITQPKGNLDYWIVKLDANGAMVWQKSYGGSGLDDARSVIQTTDGNYVVAGFSSSADGDITNPKEGKDYWIIKLDTNGELLWEKSFGGTGDDEAYSIIQTTDGGFAVAGSTTSEDGDITNANGWYDYWILKLDANGNLVWQKSYGEDQGDVAYSIIQTHDGGYGVIGSSTTINGDNDYRFIKLDALGNVVWDKSFGSSGDDVARSIVQTGDGGYVIAGRTNSTDGDVTVNYGGYDVWLVKTDSAGNLVWQKNYGGTANETGGGNAMIIANDGSLAIVSETASNDKDLFHNNGNTDYFVLNIDPANGDLNWQRNLGGTGYEQAWSVTQTTDGKFVVAGYSSSNNGDVTAPISPGWSDYWIVKLGATIEIESLDITIANNESAEVYVTQFLQLFTSVQPQYAAKGVIWSVISGGEFVNVSNAGRVEGIAAGVAVIRATSVEDPNKFNEITVTVLAPGWNQLGSTLYGDAYTHPDHQETDWSFFGYNISLSADGSIMAVGAPTDGAGSADLLNAYVGVYRFVSGEWVRIGEDIMGAVPLVMGTTSPKAGQSVSLSSDGNIVAVGEPFYKGISGNEIEEGGRARVFKNVNDEWVQIGNDISQIGLPGDGNESETFGNSVSLSADGNILAVGAPYHFTNGERLGMVRTYQNVSGLWVQLGSSLIGSQINGYFGGVVSLSKDGTTLAVSAMQAGNNAGEVKIYKFVSGEWSLTGTFNGPAAYSQLRDVSLSADGNRVVFGIPYSNSSAGSFQIHEYSNGSWTQIGGVVGAYYEQLGYSVSISDDGKTVAASSGSGFGGNHSRLRVFQQSGNEWTQLENLISIEDGAFLYNSLSLSADGSVLAVGAPQPLVGTEYTKGRAYVFQNCNLANIEVATSEIGDAVCAGETIDVSATIGAEWYEERGTINWYDSINATEPIFTGLAFTTPELSETKSYWIEAVTPTRCASERVEVSAVVNPTPQVTVEDFNAICEGYEATITVLSEGNAINWYTTETETEVLFSGAEFTTPELSETTTYWIQAVSPEGCSSQKIEVVVTVNPLPELTIEDTAISICEGATATLAASSTTGNLIVWYDNETATQWIATGTEFVTPELTQTTSYWVQAYNPQTHCASEKTEVIVTANQAPEVSVANAEITICEGKTAVLTASSATGNIIIWYNSADATERIATGAEFTTPELTQATSYWVEAYNPQTHCVSERIIITVTTNPVSQAVTEFSYDTKVCLIDTTNPVPSTVADFTLGGMFTATPSGLSINAETGEIDLSSSAEGTYVITYEIVSDENNCVVGNTNSVTITVESCVVIPRGISPNGDGMNDYFDLTVVGVRKLSVFNRYGKEVYSFANYKKEWQGQDKDNNELPDGTYYYAIEKNNGEQLTGWVYINRKH